MLDRLKKRRDFLRVASGGRKWVTPGLILQTSRAPEPETEDVRVGFTVSRRVGGAVARNRARRRLRAVAELVLAPRAKPGRDYVLIGRAATVTRPYAALIGDLETALRRLDGTGEDHRDDRGADRSAKTDAMTRGAR